MIEHNDEEYRDDRLFVINLTECNITYEETGETVIKWTLRTYRNTQQLQPLKDNHFQSKQNAIDYLKEVEYQCPLISNEGEPLDIPKEADKWLYWNQWLEKNNLFSAISEKQHMPFNKDPRGYNYAKNYCSATYLKDDPSTTNEN